MAGRGLDHDVLCVCAQPLNECVWLFLHSGQITAQTDPADLQAVRQHERRTEHPKVLRDPVAGLQI